MLPAIKNPTEYPLVPLWGFSQAAVAASQAQVAIKMIFNDATTGSNKNIDQVMLQGGTIVGISYNLDTNKTAGVLGISPTVNGNEPASTNLLYRLALGNAARKQYKLVTALQGIPFAAGDLVGAKITTDGSMAPTTADLVVTLWVVFNGVQI